MKVQLLHLLLARPDTDEAAQLRPGLRLAQLRPLLGQTTARPDNSGDYDICYLGQTLSVSVSVSVFVSVSVSLSLFVSTYK